VTTSATASPTSGSVRRRPPARRRLRLLADLRIADLLQALGTSVPVDTARRIVVGAAAGAVLLAFAAGIVAARAAAVLAPGADVVGLFVLLCAYAGLGALAGETLGRFRSCVSDHPQRDFFVGLDVRAADVFVVHALPRVAVASAVWGAAGLGVLAGSVLAGHGPGAAGTALLLGTPVAFGALTAAGALRSAARPENGRRHFPAVLAAASVLAGAGAHGAVLLLTPLVPGALAPAAGAAPGPAPGLPEPVLLAGLTAVAAVAGRRALAAVSFPARRAAPPVRRPRLSGPAVLQFARVLGVQRAHGWRLRAQQRIAVAVAAATAALLGATSAGLRMPPLPAVPDAAWEAALRPTLGFAALMTGLALAELVSSDIGAFRYGRHLRTAVESGASRSSVALGHLTALTLPLLLPALLLVVAARVLTGTLSAAPAAVVLGAVWAATVAEHLLPPPRTVEGTGADSPLTGVLTVVLAAAPVAVPLTFPATDPWIVPLLALTLAGGALTCLHRSLTRR
jgi:hypothetical protein